MAGNSSSSPAWSQRMAVPAGQESSAAALTASSRWGVPRRVLSRRASRGRPSSARIFQTVCADTGVPLAVSASAISVTEWSRARSANALSRTLPAIARALGAGPGLGEQLQLPAAEQGRHLVHAGGGVAEPVGDLGGRHLLDEVGAQCLVAAARRSLRIGEVLPSLPHTSIILLE